MITAGSVLRRSASALTLSAYLLWLPVANSAAAPRQPFTVEHSIEMTVLNDVERNLLNGETVPLSPDGRHFFVVTRKGNLATGANDYTMWLYDAEAVRKSIPSADLPQGLPIVKFSSSSNRVGIARARWLKDSRTIAFLAENPGEAPQLYTFDIQSKALTKKTDHPTAIVDFDLSLGAREFVYFAESPADHSERIAHGYEVDKTFLLDVMKGGSDLMKRGAFYIGGGADSPARAVNIEPYQFNGSHGIWLAPQGRWAIVTRLVTAAPKAWWTDYQPVNQPPFNQASSARTESFSTPNPSVFLQYMLVDVRTGEARPILDAPTGFLFGGMALDAQWQPDGAGVILANTFLPLKDVDAEELGRRKASPSVVEVNLETGEALRIRDLLIATPDDPRPMRPFVAANLQANGDLSLTLLSGGRERSILHRKIHGAWQEITASKEQKRSAARLAVAVVQDLNVPPELRATDVVSKRSKVVTDLNPQFRGLEMGQAEVFRWTDADGRPWVGGLLKPVGYEAGKRYPLVIQTHGFDPTKFLIDGPFGSPSGYAARALINRGIMVLQAQDAPPPYGVPEEPVNQVKGFESAVATLARAGLIDPERVGLHGFSRTGLAVQHALVFSAMKIAAASVADANSVGMLNYLWGFGGGYPAMMDTEWIVGAPLWGDENARRWQERDPIFHLDRVRAPLLIHAYMAPGWFDAYAILRRQQRPVEYWAYPDSAHNPVKPWHRRTTQGLTVDWYDFWLNGHEARDSAKAGQYERWRELRRLQEGATTKAAAPSSGRSTARSDLPSKQYPVESFIESVGLRGASFSADESRILFSSDKSGVWNAYSMPTSGGEWTAITRSVHDNNYSVAYFPHDDRVLVTRDQGGNELNHLYVIATDGRERDLTPGDNLKAQFGGFTRDARHFHVLTNERDPRFLDVYRYDAKSYERQRIYENKDGYRPDAIDSNGRWIALSKIHSGNDIDLFVLDLESGKITPVSAHEGEAVFAAQDFSPDSQWLYYTANEASEFAELRRLNLTSGKHELVQRAPWDIAYSSLSHSGEYRIVAINEDGSTRIEVTDVATGKPLTLPTLPDGEIRGGIIARSEKRMAFYLNGDRQPNDLYILELGGQPKQLTRSLNAAIDPKDLVDSRVVRFKSFDGLEIPNVLWKPHRTSPQAKAPAVVWVHGGPGGQTTRAHSAVIQYLVNHGYVVLGINNRGSTGYGKTFFAADDGKHGREPLWDTIAAKKYLQSLDYVDPQRIGILGGSYGGYMTLAALAFQPDEFVVGVDIFGVANWLRTLESIPPYWESMRKALYKEIGDPVAQRDFLVEISPLFHADKIKRPLLVLQGANDPRVVRAESDEIVAAVKKNGVPVEYLVFDDEGHGFTKKRNQIEGYGRVLAFLDRYLKGDGT